MVMVLPARNAIERTILLIVARSKSDASIGENGAGRGTGIISRYFFYEFLFISNTPPKILRLLGIGIGNNKVRGKFQERELLAR